MQNDIFFTAIFGYKKIYNKAEYQAYYKLRCNQLDFKKVHIVKIQGEDLKILQNTLLADLIENCKTIAQEKGFKTELCINKKYVKYRNNIVLSLVSLTNPIQVNKGS